MSLLKELLEKYKLYLDLDGVFCDFDKKVCELMNEPFDQKLYDKDMKFRKRMWSAIIQHSKEGNEFWYNLEPTHDAHILWEYVKEYNPQVLTATGRNRVLSARKQKLKWCSEYFGPDMIVNTVEDAEDKAIFSGPGIILIDDRMKAIEPWREAGGIGILHTDAVNTIRQLKELGI